MWERLKRLWRAAPGTHPQSVRRPSQIKPRTQGTWTQKQIIRLAAEKVVLASKASQFSFHEPKRPTKTYVSGWIKTSDGHKYELRVLLGPKFPDKMPRLFVTSPHRVPKYGGGFINSKGFSHKWHTSGMGPTGCAEICHCREPLWDPSSNINSVLIKGALWCEAHRKHMKTGESLAHFFNELRKQLTDDLNNYKP
jgi:hypothetical protein